MEGLLKEIRACEICKASLPLGPRPIVAAHQQSKIIIIGQAPGTKVHKTGIPWDDPSGRQLRKWLGVDDAAFYNPKNFALVPMGFCYPGKGKSGDLPPRKECAPQWHENLIKAMPSIQLTVVIGMYAQQHYLKEAVKKNLTETVKSYQDYLPGVIPLPHPSPRNRFWLTKNPWFEVSVIPQLQLLVRSSLS